MKWYLRKFFFTPHEECVRRKQVVQFFGRSPRSDIDETTTQGSQRCVVDMHDQDDSVSLMCVLKLKPTHDCITLSLKLVTDIIKSQLGYKLDES